MRRRPSSRLKATPNPTSIAMYWSATSPSSSSMESSRRAITDRIVPFPASALDDLPIGVLLHHQPLAKGVEVATVGADLPTARIGARDRPARDAGVAGDVVRGIAVVHIRHALEAAGQSLTHRCPADEATALRSRAKHRRPVEPGVADRRDARGITMAVPMLGSGITPGREIEPANAG